MNKKRSIRSRSNYRKIYESHYGTIPMDSQGRPYEVHHLDGNRNNNNVENLIAIPIEEHYQIHLAQGDWAACLRIGAKMKISHAELKQLAARSSRNLVKSGRHHWLTDEHKENTRRRMHDLALSGLHPAQKIENREKSRVRAKKQMEDRLKTKNGPSQNISGEKRVQLSQKMSTSIKKSLASRTDEEKMLQIQRMLETMNKKSPEERQHAIDKRLKTMASKTREELKSITDRIRETKNAKSLEEKQKTLERMRNADRPTYTCPHCGKVGRSSVMFRHHFDRCKKISKT